MAHRRQLTIPATGQALYGFPARVSVYLPTAPPTSASIQFRGADGSTALASELIGYDPTSGLVDAWVLSELSGTASTVMYVYYS